MGLHKAGITRFVNSKANRFVKAAVDAVKEELSNRDDLEIQITATKRRGSSVSAEVRVTSKKTNILADELGTEHQSPQSSVGKLIRDPSIRGRIISKAAQSL